MYMVYCIIITILLSVLNAFLYRFGGEAKKNNELDFLRTSKTRDIGCTFVNLITLLNYMYFQHVTINKLLILSLVLSLVISYFSLVTYHGWLTKLLGYTDDKERWFNWLACGIGFGLSWICYTFYTHQWLSFILRTVFSGLIIMGWSEFISNDVLEERGRGFLHNISLLFYLIK